jgi:hypothetical protein
MGGGRVVFSLKTWGQMAMVKPVFTNIAYEEERSHHA